MDRFSFNPQLSAENSRSTEDLYLNSGKKTDSRLCDSAPEGYMSLQSAKSPLFNHFKVLTAGRTEKLLVESLAPL